MTFSCADAVRVSPPPAPFTVNVNVPGFELVPIVSVDAVPAAGFGLNDDV